MGTRGGTRRDAFGSLALVLFLVLQVLDGVLTYVGVSTYGVSMEGNPLIAWLMGATGQGPALATAKLAAGSFGVALHLSAVHTVVAVLAGFYLVVAVIPWVVVLVWL